MKLLHLSAAFRDRAADVLCALISHPSTWAGLAAVWFAAWALICLASLAAGFRAAADRRTAAWGQDTAALWAAWLDKHGRVRTAARVRAVNRLLAT